MNNEFYAGKDDDGRRLDRIIRKMIPGLTQSRLQKAIRKKDIRLNGQKTSAESLVKESDLITIHSSLLPADNERRSETPRPLPQEIPVLFQSADLLILNKPAGRPVHGPDGLDRLVQDAFPAPDSLSFRPGPLHRLDRNTSGLITFSLSLDGARHFSEAMQRGELHKEYLAVAEGMMTPGDTFVWEDFLERDEIRGITYVSRSEVKGKGKRALTHVAVLAAGRRCSLLLCRLETGRTHQIRAQAAARNHPLAGDRKYGSAGAPPCALHAWRLSHNADVPLFNEVTAPPPAAFLARLEREIPGAEKYLR